MKVLAASDVHGNRSVYEWLVQITKEADVLVLAGDLLGCPDGFDSVEAAQRADADAVREILRAASCPIYFIMGNDDFVELEPIPDRIESLHGRRLELGRWNFVGYQYSLPFMGGVNEKSEACIRVDLDRLASRVDNETIFVTHSPAYGVLDIGVLNRVQLLSWDESRGRGVACCVMAEVLPLEMEPPV